MLALGILGLGVIFRIEGFTEWWLNPDEGIYYSVLTREHFADFWAQASATAHPPLYFLLLRGLGSLSTDFVWLRSLALVSGSAAVYIFFLVGRELGGTGSRAWLAGLLSGLALAISPRGIALSQLIRPYMLLVALLAGALYLLLRYLREPSTRLLVGYATCISLAVLLHYSSVLGIGVFACLVLADAARRGPRRPEWRRLLAVHSIPGVALVGLYFVHLRELMSGSMADTALQGWLNAYMIGSPGDVWLSVVGFYSMVVGADQAASAALLTFFALGYAAWSRAWTPLIVIGSGLLLAVAGAVLQLYPFGATRHVSWLLVFVVPVVAWSIAGVLTSGRLNLALSLALFSGLALGGERLGRVLGADRSPQEISERVLQISHVAAMSEVLDPQAEPSLVFMSAETYYMLSPLFALDRQTARRSRDGMLTHVDWGSRDLFMLHHRDFASLPGQVGLPHHLYTAARKASEEFLDAPRSDGEPVLVLAGGWRSQGMEDLVGLSRDFESLGTTISVPGLIALSLDLDAYIRVLTEASLQP